MQQAVALCRQLHELKQWVRQLPSIATAATYATWR